MEKLKNGDFCENLTKEQFDELIEIEGDEVKLDFEYCLGNTLEFDDGYLVSVLAYRKTTLLSFEDFKQRAINTFKK